MDDITSLRSQLPFCGRMVDLRAARSPGRDGLKALRVSDLEHSFEDWCRSWSRQAATWRDRLRRAYVWSPLGRGDPRLPSLPGLSPAGRRLVTIAVPFRRARRDSAPSLSVTNAFGRSPQCGCGIPMTAHSSTAGWAAIACSASMLEMFSPPEMMMSLPRSRSSMLPSGCQTARSRNGTSLRRTLSG